MAAEWRQLLQSAEAMVVTINENMVDCKEDSSSMPSIEHTSCPFCFDHTSGLEEHLGKHCFARIDDKYIGVRSGVRCGLSS